MNSCQNANLKSSVAQTIVSFLLLATAIATNQSVHGATNIIIWDTGSRLAANAEVPSVRDGWAAVPSELFVFESDPAKASSDPGYYGREYAFKGDAVVENQHLLAIFSSAKGRAVIYSKPQPAGTGASGSPAKVLEIAPKARAQSTRISRCAIVRNANDEALLEVSFSANGSADLSARFSFGKDEIIEIKPSEKSKGLTLFSPLDYGVVPAFIGDDLVISPLDYASADSLSLPAENVFVGLIKGERDEFVMTWPRGKQQLKLRLSNDAEGKRVAQAVDFDNDGQSLYIAPLSASGIWHREELKPSLLEKDAPINWKRPFPAKWKTELSEAGVKTTFAFRESKGQIWRGVPGSYNYPVWFDGDNAFLHLSKKVPPQGESIVYFLEGENTPANVSTPADIIKFTLGRQVSEVILDPAGQKLRTHHRRAGDGVHRACTCGCTEAIQAVFEKSAEADKKDFVKEALGDMNFFVECHVARIQEYLRFANDLNQFLQTKQKSAPELKAYIESLQQIAQQIPQEYDVQKENMQSAEHAADLTRKTMALTASKATNNLASYMQLLKAWRAMGGAQDYVVAQCHMLTRKLFQEAGYAALQDPKALGVAQEVRSRCRQVLRNPDGYEIWANY